MINLFQVTFILSIIYIFDEKLNFFLGFNGAGFLLIFLLYIFNYRYFKISHLALVLASALIIYAFLVAFFSPCEWYYKSIFSIISLILLILLVNGFFINKIVTSDLSSKFIILILILSIILNELINSESRSFRLFYENSWMGIYISPFIIYRILSNNKDIYSWFAILIVSIFCFSTTFFILIILLFLIILARLNRIIYIIPGLFVLFTFYLISSEALIDRLDTILNYESYDGSGNLSSYVWLNGFSMAFQNFITTSGLGVGFNSMGCISSGDTSGVFSSVIEIITGGVLLNFEDGSFLSAKLISELGFLGVLITLVFTTLSIRNLLFYIFKKSLLDNNLDCITGSILMLVLLFVRSGGYYQLIVILSLSLLFSRPYIRKTHLKGVK